MVCIILFLWLRLLLFGVSSNYINNKSIYGSDYDRVNKNNSNLNIYFCASGSWGNNIYSGSSNDIAFDLNVKVVLLVVVNIIIIPVYM